MTFDPAPLLELADKQVYIMYMYMYKMYLSLSLSLSLSLQFSRLRGSAALPPEARHGSVHVPHLGLRGGTGTGVPAGRHDRRRPLVY